MQKTEARNRQEGIVTLYFNRGAHVQYNGVGGPFTGHVECDCNGRPGWYYVRKEVGKTLDLVQWMHLKLVAP